MTIKELKEMINLMQENGLSELEIEKNGLKIRLKKGTGSAVVQEVVQAAPLPQVTAAHGLEEGKPVEEEGVEIVRSPMVGTFYMAPAPDAAPYVATGKDVMEGDVICIIEAMKLMNEIKSEIAGRVTEILVENGQPVEFDQPLFKIQKN